jgi:hypothetical protein
MDHVTKGDEPFQEIVSSQLLEQPPRLDVDIPLKGRKTLIFSDGRQAASRLAGKLQQYSMRDAVHLGPAAVPVGFALEAVVQVDRVQMGLKFQEVSLLQVSGSGLGVLRS